MNRIWIAWLLLFCAALAVTVPGCADAIPATPVAPVAPEYIKIDATEAKRMLDEDADQAIVLLDVRTGDEFASGHIEGAMLIPDFELAERAATELTDPDATILVYCRSGRRSAASAKALIDLGYTRVYDFGGIIDWPFETVTGDAT